MLKRQSMSSENDVNNFTLGLAIAGNAQIDADNANRRAADAENRAMLAELESAGKTTDRDLERRLEDANKSERSALLIADILKNELAKKNALLIDWMHSSDAFKRLARQYGTKLGVTNDQRDQAFGQCIIDVAEENPQFKNTSLMGKVEKALGVSKP